jgi:hypothetical protein
MLYPRVKPLSHKKKHKHSKIPEEYYTSGSMGFARYGKLIVGRSLLTKEQHEAVRAQFASNLPNVISEIDALVTKIAAKVSCLPPGKLLHSAWWEYVVLAIKFDTNESHDAELSLANRMIDYLQSIIASVAPSDKASGDLSEDDWLSLKEDVSSLFARLTSEYQACKTADLLLKDPQADMEREGFRFRSETYWLNVRGKRYQSHETQALIEILTPQTDILEKVLGVDAALLVNELEKILIKLTSGLESLFKELIPFQENVLDRFQEIAEQTGISDFDELRDKVYEDQNLATQMSVLAGEFAGLDFFDVEKITCLPRKLLDELAWSPGEEKKFFEPGDFCGWPLRLWPIMMRPFLRLDDRILCFDMFSLFDNVYRALERIIFKTNEKDKQTWLGRRKDISEELPFTYFQRILPGAKVLRSVYYPSKAGSGSMKWCETDGLVIYEDHLFIVEVKGGSFTYTSPANDFPAHIDSLNSLIQSPVSQGNRLLDYLESADEVSIADSAHQEIARLRRSDFRHVTICAMTLDPFTEIAARSQRLEKIGLDMGGRSVWVLSIDDMRVYADLFDDPLVFLHYVEQRMAATRSELVDLDDEMSHIGLYVAENKYSQYAKRLVGDASVDILTLDGYRQPIDEYYRAMVYGSPIPPPRQSLPARFAEIVSCLTGSSLAGRAKLASFLLDIEKGLQFSLSAEIDKRLLDNPRLGRAQLISTYVPTFLTVYCWSSPAPRSSAQAVYDTRVVMVLGKEATRSLMELEYDDSGVLQNVHWQEVSLMGLSQGELEHLASAAEILRQRRVTTVREQRKIGRNELCPCASGVKFKRCCL